MEKFKKILYNTFLFLMALTIVFSGYIRYSQPTSDIPELIFCLNYGLSNSDFSPVYEGIKVSLPFFILLYSILIYLFNVESIGKYKKKNKFLLNLMKHKERNSFLLLIFTLGITLYNFNYHTFIYNELITSNFIEENYVDPNTTNIEFKEKNNLVFIVLESFESTLLNKNKGGAWEYSIVPEIEKINDSNDTITFTNKDKYKGMKMIHGATYTTASVFTNQSGIPFKYSTEKKLTSDDFMKGSYSLGDVLEKNGYHNELISAATSSFGGFKEYYTNHGKYDIIDIDSYKKYGLTMTEKDKSAWGFNDNYLYNAAKERLSILSKQEQPFNLTLVSIDTHFPTGFVGEYSETKYDDSMANAYATESRLVGEFVDWIKNQDFYKNTTIVILGDHLSMANQFYSKTDNRNIYISYINSKVSTNNLENREYTALDTYPTILASIGANIEGNQLGLGINMFSDKETLAEKYGFDELNKEISKKSVFYNEKIMVN